MYNLIDSGHKKQGYRNRYGIIYRPSGSFIFCEITKVSDFGTSEISLSIH